MPFNVLDESTAAVAPTTTVGAPLSSVGETLDTMRAELIELLGNRDNILPPRYNKWLNWGYRNVAGMLHIKELNGSLALTTVAGQPFYSLPVQVASIIRLAVSDSTFYAVTGGCELDMIDEAAYRLLPVVTDTIPQKYFRWRRMVVVYPTPDAAYTLPLDFKVRPDDMVDDTDSPLLPQEFHEPIILSARYRALRALQQYEDANRALNDFLLTIRPLVNTDTAELPTQNAVITPMKSGLGSQVWRR